MSFAQNIRQKGAELWHIQRVKRLVRDGLGLGPHALIRVVELPCAAPDCPGPITEIRILGLDLTRFMIVMHRPLADVCADDLAKAVESDGSALPDRASSKRNLTR